MRYYPPILMLVAVAVAIAMLLGDGPIGPY